MTSSGVELEPLRGLRPGRGRQLRSFLAFAGPAFIASVAYIDPGNFATNIQAGSAFGYRLLWVVMLANAVAILLQALSAKIGIVTGKNLAEHSRDSASPVVAFTMWIVCEIAAMATDLAEFLGATLALNLLFGVPMLLGTAITGAVTYGILMLQRNRRRVLECIIVALIGMTGAAYLVEVVIVKPDWRAVAYHSVTPWLGSGSSVLLAVGIIGATVMPHAIYLHSDLAKDRCSRASFDDIRAALRLSHIEVGVALGFACLVNLAMVIMSAAVFARNGDFGIADITTAYRTLEPLLGTFAAGVFLIALLASGISSSVVGTMSGQVMMQSFVRFRIPLWVRRAVTMLPAIVVIQAGIDPTKALVVSQVVLSFVLPLPAISVIWFSSRRSVMGAMANTPFVTACAIAAGCVIVVLNAWLLWSVAYPA